MSQVRVIAAGICIVFLLAGLSSCLVGPKLQDPQLDIEEQFRFDSLLVDTIGDIYWWDIFPDTQLYNLVQIALVENQFVQQAAARIEEARATVGFRRADQYPRFDAQISASRSNLIQGINISGAQNQFVMVPTMNWEIDFWGKFRHATRAAKQEMLASTYGQRVVMLDLVTSVVSNYILILQVEQQLEIARRTLDSRVESTGIIQARYDGGTVAEIDLNQAQIQEEIAAAAIPFFERELAILENAISVLLGRNPSAIPRGSLDNMGDPDPLPPGIPSAILARRPDIMEQYHLLEAQNEYIGVAIANRLPNISLNGLFGLGGSDLSMVFSSDGVVWSIGAGLLQPIFQFGKNLRRVEIEETRLEQQLLNYEATVINAFREVEDALISIDTYEREFAARRRQREAASNARELSRARYDGGQTSYLEVLEQERSLFDAELVEAEVHASYLLAHVDIYRALGGGWLSQEAFEASQAAREAARRAGE